MPSIKERKDHSVSVSSPYGAGGEPPAAPPGILQGVPDEIRRRLPDDVVDELLAGAKTEEEIVGPGGLLTQLTKRLVERALEVELTDHVGDEPHREPPGGTGNTRNGSTQRGFRPSTARWRSGRLAIAMGVSSQSWSQASATL